MAHLVLAGGLPALRKARFADLTVTSNKNSWLVHKVNFAGESEALAATIDNAMKEGSTNTVTFDDYLPPTIACLIHFQYVGFYDEIQPVKSHVRERLGDQAVTSMINTDKLKHKEWQMTPAGGDFSHGRRLYGQKLSQQDLNGVLAVNIELHRLSDMYELPELKKVAIGKILGAEQFYVESEFDRILDYLWEHTAPDDIQIRLAVYRRCTLNYKIIELYPAIETKLKELVGFVAWETTKLHLAEANEKEEQVRSAAQRQTNARVDSIKEQASDLKKKLSETEEKLISSKQNNTEFLNRNIQLRGDLMDIKSEWQRVASISCSACKQTVANTKWTEERDARGRLLWLCTCGKKWAAQQ